MNKKLYLTAPNLTVTRSPCVCVSKRFQSVDYVTLFTNTVMCNKFIIVIPGLTREFTIYVPPPPSPPPPPQLPSHRSTLTPIVTLCVKRL